MSSPLYGVVPVLHVLAVRVQEDVLVYPSAQAEHVRRRVFARLQHLQHHSESLLPVPGTVPPARRQSPIATTQLSEADMAVGVKASFLLQASV